MSKKKMTSSQAKSKPGESMCRVLGISVELTKTGLLSTKTAHLLNQRGYYWFPSERVWKKLGGG